jgi:hypothetical protein
MGIVFADSAENPLQILNAWLADAALSKWYKRALFYPSTRPISDFTTMSASTT